MSRVGRPIVVVEYDSTWAETFELVRGVVAASMSQLLARVEHVGSTAVPGLAAKPIVDVDALLFRGEDLRPAIDQLSHRGYRHEGDRGIHGREAFSPPSDLPYHHLYVCLPECEEFVRHVAFRDFLRSHDEVACEYGELKRRLAERFRGDRDSYTEAKTAFVAAVLAQALREC